MLEEGLQEAQKKMARAKQIRESGVYERAEFDGFNPVQIPVEGESNVDILIRRKMGGRRVGMMIVWDVEEGSYQFDPINGKLSKI